MSLFVIFKRHLSYAAQVDAYADGELRGRDLSRFEAHLATCGRCTAAVVSARDLKALVAGLPVAAAPRSFRIAPATLGAASPQPVRSAGTPLYLGLVRAGAAFSVVAFATVLAFNALGTSSEGDDDDGGTAASRESAGAAYDAALATPTDKSSGGGQSSAATPQLAPPSGGEAVGSSAPTPSPTVSRVPLIDSQSSPVPVPATGGSGVAPVAPDTTEALSTADYQATPAGNDGDGVSPVVVSLGILAAASIALLVALEAVRRLRHA